MVQLKKKVTLKTKIPNKEPIVSSEPQTNDLEQKVEKPFMTTDPKQANEREGKGKGKLWISLLVVCVLLIGVYLVFSGDDNSQASLTKNEGKPVVENLNHKDSPKDNVEQKQGAPSDVKGQSPISKPESSRVEKPKGEETPAASTKPVMKSEPTKKSTNRANAQSRQNLINGSLEQKANAVIRGDYGNGLERKEKLGSEYTEIQNKVNEMYKNGLVD